MDEHKECHLKKMPAGKELFATGLMNSLEVSE